MVVNVLELIVTPFTERDHDAQVQIVKEGKPLPTPIAAIFENCSEVFSDCPGGTDVFNQVKWLTCYEIGQEAFVLCWPCLLFRTQASSWNRGISNLTYAFQNLGHHEREAEHLDAVFKLQIFAMQNMGKPRLVIDKIQHNDEVRRNVTLFRRFTEAVCSFVKGRSECSDRRKCNLLDKNDCLQFLNYHSGYKDVVDYLRLSDSPKVLNDLVDAITMVFRKAIMDEVEKSSYVSVILSEHTTGLQSQISTVLRYINDGNVCERFVGFSDRVEYHPTSHNVISLILNTLKSYRISDKFLSLSLDGAVLPRSECNDLVRWLQTQSCKLPFLVPCNFHGVGHVLLDSMLHFKECVHFFTTYREIEHYFQITSLRSFQCVLKARLPTSRLTEWYAKPPFILLLCTYRKQFLEYFIACIAANKRNQTSSSARETTFRKFLEDPKTVFLLMLFHRIFSGFFDEQFNFISTSSSIKHISEVISRLNSKMIQTFTVGFQPLWSEVLDDVKDDISRDTGQRKLIMGECEHLFQKVLNHLIQETNFRGADLLRLSFCDMLACDSQGRIPFRNSHVSKLISEMGSDFDEVGFNNEIKVAKGVVTPIFQHKSLHTLLRTFVDNNLADVFPQFYRVNELLLTVPLYPVKYHGLAKNHSKLQDIEMFTYVPTVSGTPSGDTSVLCVEKLYLEDLQRSESFYNDVIEQYRLLNTDLALHQV